MSFLDFPSTLMLKSYRDDLDYLSVIASLPPQQTAFEYLVGCWKRLNATRYALLKKVGNHASTIEDVLKKGQVYTPVETQAALDILEKLRNLIISYAGLILQEPDMFPQPVGYAIVFLVSLFAYR